MKGCILIFFLIVIVLIGLQVQNIFVVFRLVVGLIIDQLWIDYIEVFLVLYGECGFKWLWREGWIYWNVEYDFINVDKLLVVVVIYFGIIFYINGIVGDNWMDCSIL